MVTLRLIISGFGEQKPSYTVGGIQIGKANLDSKLMLSKAETGYSLWPVKLPIVYTI